MFRNVLQGRPLKHPLHALLIHLPIGMFLLSLVLDLASFASQSNPELLQASCYAIVIGIISALAAATAGLADFLDIRQDSPAKKLGWVHMGLNICSLSLYTGSAWIRWHTWDAVRPGPEFFTLSVAGFLVLGVSGFVGGKMVYDHGVGVGRHRREPPTPAETFEATAPPDAAGYVTLFPAAELSENKTARVEIAGVIMTLAKCEGLLFAFQEFCTHRYGPLSEGEVKDGKVTCPWHGSCFDLRTGAVVHGPAKVPVRTFEVRVTAEGLIQVKKPEPSVLKTSA